MADKYYRLVSLVVNVCPLPLRELFHLCAQTDNQFTGPYTTHSYLQFRRNDIAHALATKTIRRDQYNKIYPATGQTDLTGWDTTLLIAILKLLFRNTLTGTVLTHIENVRDCRNYLQHISATASVSDAEFSTKWGVLEAATVALAKNAKGYIYADEIRKRINSAKTSHMPDLGDVRCEWYKENTLRLESKVNTLQEEVTHLKEKLDAVSKDTQHTKSILDKVTVKSANSLGKGCKRFKTVDNQQDLMLRKFSETIRHGLPVDPISFSELPDIYEKLNEDHLVVVFGTRNSSYLQAALTAIEGMGYAKDRCFELNEASDWWRVTFEEADCIVVVNPFGKVFFDKHKASAMSDVFNSMLSATRDEQVQGFKFHDIVIITEKALLYDCKKYFPHDLLEAEITIPESEIIEGTSKPALDDVSIDDTYTDDTAANKELRYIRDLNISNPEEANADIAHLCTIPPNQLALTDRNNNSLRLMDIRNGITTACTQLTSIPGSLAVLPQDNLAVVLPDACLIQLFSIHPILKKGRSIKVNDACGCITYVNGMLFAFFYTRHIKAYNLKGEVLETLTLDPEIHDLCSYSFFVSVCPNKTSFYISDMDKCLLFRMNLKGKVIAMYKDKDDFDEPEQILATSDGSIFVCNSAKNTVLQMRADLTRPRVILGRSDNVISPRSICYCQEENIIIIACISESSSENHDTLKLFSVIDI